MTESSKSKYRPLTFGVTRVALRDGEGGTQYLQAEQKLEDFPERITDRVQHWAHNAPERTFMAKQATGITSLTPKRGRAPGGLRRR